MKHFLSLQNKGHVSSFSDRNCQPYNNNLQNFIPIVTTFRENGSCFCCPMKPWIEHFEQKYYSGADLSFLNVYTNEVATFTVCHFPSWLLFPSTVRPVHTEQLRKRNFSLMLPSTLLATSQKWSDYRFENWLFVMSLPLSHSQSFVWTDP